MALKKSHPGSRVPSTHSALCKPVSVSDTAAQVRGWTPENLRGGITIPRASKASSCVRQRDFPGGDFYTEGVKMTGCPSDLAATWGKPEVCTDTGLSSCSPLRLLHTASSKHSPSRLILRACGVGGGQVAGSLSGLCVRHELLGSPQNLTSGYNFSFLII